MGKSTGKKHVWILPISHFSPMNSCFFLDETFWITPYSHIPSPISVSRYPGVIKHSNWNPHWWCSHLESSKKNFWASQFPPRISPLIVYFHMVFPWFSHDFPIFPWFSIGFPMVFHWFSHGFPMVSANFYRASASSWSSPPGSAHAGSAAVWRPGKRPGRWRSSDYYGYGLNRYNFKKNIKITWYWCVLYYIYIYIIS